MGNDFTYRELLLLAHDTPTQIRLRLLVADTHEAFLELVEQAIDWIAQEFAKTRQHRLDRDEDGLTIDLVTTLKSMGFQASHDTAYGGHCDVVVEARGDFLWLGEAKIHKGYDWLLKGFQQLDTRYATALPKQDHGGMIIYCRQSRADQMMDKWASHLSAARPDVAVQARGDGSLIFHSEHTHDATGRRYHVRHLPICLHFAPKDQAGKKPS